MRVFSAALVAAGILLVPVSGSAATTVRPHRRSSTHALVRHDSSAHARRSEHAATERAYAGMSTERATEIQSALIRQGYLAGEPTGSWDSSSFAAMQKLQSDNGWQTKLVPDSRALIKLGLGPNSSPAANASAAMDVPAHD